MKKNTRFQESAICRASRSAIVVLVSGSLPLSYAGLPLGSAPPVMKTVSEPAPNVVLTLDNSGSMGGRDIPDPITGTPNAKTRIAALREIEVYEYI